MEFLNATEYIKQRNEIREENGTTYFNLSEFMRSKKVQKICDHLKKEGLNPYVITRGNGGKTLICKELFHLLQISENPLTVIKLSK
jgi:hypothetical protein